MYAYSVPGDAYVDADQPQHLRNIYDRVSYAGAFRMVLMFKPNEPGDWVPLRETTWHFEASAEWTGPGQAAWSVYGDSSGVIAANVRTYEHPTWAEVIKNEDLESFLMPWLTP